MSRFGISDFGSRREGGFTSAATVSPNLLTMGSGRGVETRFRNTHRSAHCGGTVLPVFRGIKTGH